MGGERTGELEPSEQFLALGGWPGVVSRLLARDDLSSQEAGSVLGEVLEGRAPPVNLAAFLVALRAKGETPEELAGLVASMRAHGERVELPGGTEWAVDTCGTGGDRSGTINVSTVAAFVVAGAGVTVCKHGNRAATSLAGSADVLEELGVAIALGPAGVAACAAEAGMAFCLAPRYHPSLRHAAAVRKELGVPTVFNILGPLANPAGVRRQVVGVGDGNRAVTMLGALERGGALHALVVHGLDGLDELSTVSRSRVLESRLLADGSRFRREYEVDPADLGLAPAALEDLRGGDVVENASRVRAILAGDRGPQRELVLLNAAAGLVVAGRVEDLAAGLELAESTLDSGAARFVAEQLVEASQRAAAAGLL
ncbi:MAG: Anthranilate phosphoribosyltransferase [Acidimicrobiaceae bacterium]|nr:Anthranilate phosphoribosyltransferase [Acidimicrobiaceae bacterium]